MKTEEKKARMSKDTLKKSLKLYKYIKPYRGEFAVGLVFLLLSSLANLAFPKYLGELVDATNSDSIVENIQQISLILIGILIIQAIVSFFRVVLFVNVTEKTLASLRQATYTHLIKLPITFFNQKRVGELNSRISSDISLLQETFTTTLAEFIRQLVIIFGGITILLYTSPQLTLFMLAVVPVVVVLAIFFGRFIRKFSKMAQQQVAESNTIVEETLQGIFNVKAFANEFLEIARYRTKTKEVAQTGMKGGKYRGAFSSFIILGMFGAIVAVIWQGVNLIAQGELQTGELFSFVIYSGFIGASIGGFANVYASIQKALGATEELMEILEEPTEDLQEEETKSELQNFSGKVTFKNLSFNYPNRKDIQVLKDINFEALPGQQIALVGPSGAGKSTMVSLILRFYNPTSGHLLFDDKDAAEYGLSELRNQMAVVPQDVFLFGGSIRENIAYGKPDASEEEIIEAAKKSNAWEFIQDFPEKLDTLVGERGVQLSGGQRQRVAIARAVLKNPKILILDEATSALDSESERLVQDALDKLMVGRTSIVIAHRLATVRQADAIVVLEKGMVKEIGTHEELLNIEEGIYRNLSQLQFTT
ncbi:ABC transporter ATP-binding protein [Owenweeksia hongkongensis]|uniref:ABC transporter ATP-binding protein n=1 Tax=Owenweeksia hongkongensis TaxID=253245 RepID=UPI003A9491A8